MRTVDLARLAGVSIRTAASAKKLIKEGGDIGGTDKVSMVARLYANRLFAKKYLRKLQYNTNEQLSQQSIVDAFNSDPSCEWIAQRAFADLLVDDLIEMIRDYRIPLENVINSFKSIPVKRPAMEKFIESLVRVCQARKTF